MNFTRDDIARQFDSRTFGRGEAYAREGAVLRIWRNGDTMEGVVEGSGGSIYEQSVKLTADRRGPRFAGRCSCPMDVNCKHVVALLLASLEQGEDDPESDLPAAAEFWVQQLATVKMAMQPAVPAPIGAVFRLAYVLAPDQHDGSLRLQLCAARLRKDGSFGSVTIKQDIAGLLASPPAYVEPGDEERIRLVAAMQAGSMFAEGVRPSGPIGRRLLGQLCADGHLLWAESTAGLKRGDVFPVQPGPQRSASLGWHADGIGGESVQLAWRFDDGAPVEYVMATDPLCYLDQGTFGELVLPGQLATLAPLALLRLVEQSPSLKPEQRAPLAQRLADAGLDHMLPLPKAVQAQQRRDIVPTPHLLLDSYSTFSHGAEHWHDFATLSFDYDGLSTDDTDEPVLRRMLGDTLELIERDAGAEAAASRLLAGLGFIAPTARTPLDEWFTPLLLPTQAAWIHFARRELPRLRDAGWEIEFEDFRYGFAEAQEWYADLSEEGEGAHAWFDLELGILVDGRRHALLPLLLEMIRRAPKDFNAAGLAARDESSEVMVALPDGTLVVLPWSRVKPILTTLGELHFSERMGSSLRLPVIDAARLAALEAAAKMRWMGGERLRELGRKLAGFDGIRPVAVPSGLQATLRSYQHAGLEWMQFLREYGFGGILADDMGLGKTVQTLAHILVEKESGRLDAPALVVAPTSLMGNWQAEAARFAPGLRLLLLHGKERTALFDDIAGADLVLTTYALLGRDEELLRRQRYHLLILDEAQYIKNSRSRAAQVACLLDARHRLCLTGTPVQNHLGELWSQFHFLMPGLLGEEKAFNTAYRKPIEKHGDSLRKELLVRRVKPFMLRRTKDKVARELPPKTEIVLPIEFGAGQRDLYETVRLAMDKKVRDEIDRKGLARSQIVILDALLKLRQVCCDPRLLKSTAGNAGSAKLDALMELLETLLSEGRKVLVFSQFTSMLALIEQELRTRSVEFALLTGDTVDRAAAVASFQQGQVGVFLISLKAGGVGLNLTAADTVIHYDPWWNPAAENQATDRAWRIGQDQPVFVYKLIARGTLEEKIQELQRRKGDLAAAVLDAGGELAPAIAMEDLQAIFAPPAA